MSNVSNQISASESLALFLNHWALCRIFCFELLGFFPQKRVVFCFWRLHKRRNFLQDTAETERFRLDRVFAFRLGLRRFKAPRATVVLRFFLCFFFQHTVVPVDQKDLHAAIGGLTEADVAGLQVPMKNACLMCLMKNGLNGLYDVLHLAGHFERTLTLACQQFS